MSSKAEASRAEDLLSAVRGGRVAHTGFLAPDEAAALVARLRGAEASVHVWGGFPGARRRVVTAFPESIPEATTPLRAVYAPGIHDPDELRVALSSQLSAEAVGDAVAHQDGSSLILLASAEVPEEVSVRGRRVRLEPAALEHVASGSRKQRVVIVPSLRVDALGAKAFGVSRSYFSRGIAAGNVTLNGRAATKSSSAEAGDEIYAEGLGRLYLLSVQGETRRGNLKVAVDIES